ncbi:MAG: ABC transporter ATP-binding protein [Anaerolineae bacterium]|nr:ABC transporter ATP-binding protein [Anaerolineae bacterium]
MYRGARSTWRGRSRVAPKTARVDLLVDSLIDLFVTVTQVQDQKRAADQVHDISRQFNLEVDPDAYIEKLPVGIQQRVEIVKALYRKADILILDEPTAVLTPQESRELFKIMKQLASQGVSIIFITHKLKEVLEVADRIIVMRAGKVAGVADPQNSTDASLAAMMVGREVMLRVDKAVAEPGAPVLVVEGVSARDERGAVAVNGVSFEVCVGEILGIAGVQGNGQTELVEVLTGLREPIGGTMQINGHLIHSGDPRAVTTASTGHVPEDRHRYGMVMPFPVSDNLVLNQYYEQPFATYPSWRQLPIATVLYLTVFAVIALIAAAVWTSVLWPALQSGLNLAELNPRRETGPFIFALLLTVGYATLVFFVGNALTALMLSRIGRLIIKPNSVSDNGLIRDEEEIRENAIQLVEEFDIRTPGIEVKGGNLSGGNQQKMVVAREFSRQPRLLIASQPTRGIDVGSIEFIHKRIVQLRDEGAAVLLVSAELDEIVALSDRIAVMYKGEIIAVLPAEQATREQLGLLMAGVKPEVASSNVFTEEV